MRAIEVTKYADGLGHLAVVDRSPREPGDGEVRVRMLMSPINPSDLNHIRGTYDGALRQAIWNQGAQTPSYAPGAAPMPSPPFVIGGEGVGIVEATGTGWMARRLRGKRVAIAAGPPEGAWQTSTVVAARRALTVPASVSDEQAAMSFINPLTATIMVREVLRVPAGGWLLQSAAGSAVGKMVVRLGREMGFRTINVVRSAANVEALRAHGADAIIDSSREDVVEAVHRLTDGKGVGYALDCVGGDAGHQLVRCMGVDGHMVVYGTLSPDPISLPSRLLMMPCSRISGFFLPNWLMQQPPLRLLRVLRQARTLIAKAVFETAVSEIFDLADFKAALEAASRRDRTGKVLLKIGER